MPKISNAAERKRFRQMSETFKALTGTSISTLKVRGNRLLFHAISKGSLGGVRHLVLDEKVDVNGDQRFRPLHHSIMEEKNDITKFLLGCDGIDVTTTRKSGKTALHIAATTDDLDLVKTLIKMGADPNTLALGTRKLDTRKLDTLGFAAGWNALDIVKFLVEKHNVPIRPNALVNASYHVNIVRYFVKTRGVDVNTRDEKGETVLYRASEAGKMETIKFLVEECDGVDINALINNNSTALKAAVETNENDAVEYLLDHGADPTIGDPLSHIIAHDLRNFFPRFADHPRIGADPVSLLARVLDNKVNQSLSGVEMVKHLTGKIEDINVVIAADSRRTALHIAAFKGLKGVVQHLVEDKGCDITIKDAEGKTARDLAVAKTAVGDVYVEIKDMLGETCPICMTSPQGVMLLTPCGHAYCGGCFARIFFTGSNCAMCRRAFTAEDMAKDIKVRPVN